MNRILLAIVSLLLFACAARQTPRDTPLSEDQRQATVAIYTACIVDGEARAWGGSGVIVGSHTVITAFHVVRCPGISIVTVKTLAGELLGATMVDYDAESDVANIVTDGPLPDHTFDLGPLPKLGDVVCSESAIPTRARKCGPIIAVEDEPSKQELRWRANIVGGNSGSGLYDTEGRLIGVVTMRNGESTIGAAGGLQGFGRLWEPR